MIAYLDTSAAMKLLVEESESEALTAYLESAERLDVVASWLLNTELLIHPARMTLRPGFGHPPSAGNRVTTGYGPTTVASPIGGERLSVAR